VVADATRELVERTRAAAGDGAPLAIEGRGSKAFFGRAPRGTVISTRAHSGVIDYEPGELVITVRSGSPVSEIEALLAAQGQRLAFEPPDFGQSTIGGVLATNLSGPARPWLGSGRDTLLGAKIIDGNGEVLSFGGRVMKNVAGYDVSRFQCGGMGCYGILSEVSLRVLPAKPVTLSLSASTSDAAHAIVVMNKLGGAPLPLTGLSWLSGVLRVRFEGGAGSLTEARQSLTRVAPDLSFVDDEPDFWTALRHQTLPF
jgi:glycolate oxidase FAD binding subunit